MNSYCTRDVENLGSRLTPVAAQALISARSSRVAQATRISADTHPTLTLQSATHEAKKRLPRIAMASSGLLIGCIARRLTLMSSRRSNRRIVKRPLPTLRHVVFIAQAIILQSNWDGTLRGVYKVLRAGGYLVFETRDQAYQACREWNRSASHHVTHVEGVGDRELGRVDGRQLAAGDLPLDMGIPGWWRADRGLHFALSRAPRGRGRVG